LVDHASLGLEVAPCLEVVLLAVDLQSSVVLVHLVEVELVRLDRVLKHVEAEVAFFEAGSTGVFLNSDQEFFDPGGLNLN